jgi:Clp amino terminal domain, pathogenicity island component
LTRQRATEPNAAAYHPWRTYIAAREEARARGDRRVGTEDLLVALLLEPGLAEAVGVDDQAARAALAELDRQALAAAGIDLRLEPQEPAPRRELPRRPTLKKVLHGRLPMTPVAKKTLQAAKNGRRRGRWDQSAEHVLAALLELERPDPAAELLAHLGIDPATAGKRLDRA